MTDDVNEEIDQNEYIMNNTDQIDQNYDIMNEVDKQTSPSHPFNPPLLPPP